MKKIIILTIASLAFGTASAFTAAPEAKKIVAENKQIEQRDTTVYVDFDITIGKRVARSGHTVVYRPYLVNGDYRWDLPEVIVQQSRAKIAEERHEWVSGQTVTYDNPVILRGGDKFHYNAAVPRQGWMNGANLEVEIIDTGCCEADVYLSDVLAENIALPTPVAIVPVWVPDPNYVAPVTTGDMLAEEMQFVLPATEFDETQPAQVFDDDRESALKVHFAVGKSVLEKNRGNNAEVLKQLLDAIDKLQAAPDSRVKHVVVAGFASPEGSFRLNDRLAWNRASALKKYIEANTDLDPDIIHMYNGIEDWYGLRMLVEKSNLRHKDAVIDIIDTVPIWDPERQTGREIEIKKLDSGWTYSYMLKNFFPELRAAAYIKVYYGTNDDEEHFNSIQD